MDYSNASTIVQQQVVPMTHWDWAISWPLENTMIEGRSSHCLPYKTCHLSQVLKAVLSTRIIQQFSSRVFEESFFLMTCWLIVEWARSTYHWTPSWGRPWSRLGLAGHSAARKSWRTSALHAFWWEHRLCTQTQWVGHWHPRCSDVAVALKTCIYKGYGTTYPICKGLAIKAVM